MTVRKSAARGLLAGLVTLAAANAGAGGGSGALCASNRDRRFSGGEDAVQRARKCAAGDVDACRGLDWIVGAGPADLNEIPEELAGKIERVLATFCSSGDEVACSIRGKILVRLRKPAEALTLYRTACASDWLRCIDAGRLELEAGHLSEALGFFAPVCEAGYDGDHGGSCRCTGEILEQLDRRDEARRAFEAGCSHGDNEACAASWRLQGRAPKRGSWEGLYRSASGTLLVEEKGEGRVAVRMETLWTNGHTCSFAGDGRITGDVVRFDPAGSNLDCRPVLTRKGREVSIADPGDACRRASCGVRGSFEETFTRVEEGSQSRGEHAR